METFNLENIVSGDHSKVSSSETRSLSTIIKSLMEKAQPWFPVFFSISYYRLPHSYEECQGRVLENLQIFKSNYVAILLLLMLYYLVTNILALIIIGFAFIIYYVSSAKEIPKTAFGKEIQSQHRLIAIIMITIPILYATGMRMLLFYSSETAFIIVLLHSLCFDQTLLSKNQLEKQGDHPV
ncbi:PRA1 family protein F2-like [Stegodyphus dumicola]|uniref:PRA1 family protein F2-like n=1 Tax=Stegodyphus dumicola TaxID=202533 RepID=UPI0015A94697|nr:PRA1 family protein F2-like [Stegodyphus dumicola]